MSERRPLYCSACGLSDDEAGLMMSYNGGEFRLCIHCLDLSHEILHRAWSFDEFGEHFAAEVLPCA